MAEERTAAADRQARTMTAVLLVAHGSRLGDPGGTLMRLCEAGRNEFEGLLIELAYCELQQPDLQTAIDRCAAAGVRQVLLYPCFLLAGRHVTRDLPAALAIAQQRHPELIFQIEPPLGADPGLTGLVSDGLRRGLTCAGWQVCGKE